MSAHAPQQITERSCPACTQAETKPLPYGNEQWPVAQCAICGFVYLTKAPVYERLSEEFAWEQTSEAERLVREEREPVKQSISRALKTFRREVLKRDKLGDLMKAFVPSGKVLDIGCAGGGFLANLPAQYTPYGIEISKQLSMKAASIVEPRGGTITHENAFNGVRALPANLFDCVVMSSFLEHEVEPSGLLEGIERILAPGGVVIIKVPNFASWNRHLRADKWCGFRLPDHVNYFTPASLKHLIEHNGLTVEQFGWKDRHPFSDNMWLVAGKAA
ncbi:MAG: class I SAM-dependent methyltransferase [Limnobacter sp.]|nr:class I SAM-dependent methyltransferase [Limnobacter sp.]